jgi:hypothetical protein
LWTTFAGPSDAKVLQVGLICVSLFGDGDCQRRAQLGGLLDVLVGSRRRLGVEQHYNAVVFTLIEYVSRGQDTLA